MVSYGIDFGTTNSIVAAFDGRKTTSFLDDKKLPHPSIIWYQGDKKPIVGRQAKDQFKALGNSPGNYFIKSIKSQIEQEEAFEIFGKPRKPWQIASEIFSFLKGDIATRYKGFPEVKEAVITVPLYFNGKQRRAIRQAAEEAGIGVKTFIHEPFAAVIGYILSEPTQYQSLKEKRENVLVFDWGGGTLDITLVQLDSGHLYEISSSSAVGRSGDYFDEVLMSDILEEFKRKKNISSVGFKLEDGVENLLLHDVEFAKIELSDNQKTSIELSDFYKQNNKIYNLVQDITRSRFESLIDQNIEDARKLIDQVLKEARLKPSQINQVLLTGGTSCIPLLKEKIYEMFGFTKVVELSNANTIIAEGAAIISHHNWQPYLVHPICIELCDESQYTVFDKGTILNPDTAKKRVSLFCNDNTDGEGRLIITENLENNRNKVKEIVNIPVAKNLKKIYEERIFAEFGINKDVILRINANGIFQNKPVYTEIHDLCYGLRFA